VSPVEIAGTDDYGNPVSAAAAASFGSRQSGPPPLAVTPAQAALTAAAPSAQIALSLGGAALAWSATVVSQYGASWLGIAPSSGTGGGPITLTANSAGLAPGYYSATLLIVAQGAFPQSVSVPVSLAIGAVAPPPAINSGGVTNAWDVVNGKIAPGSMISVWGANLTAGNQAALTPSVPFVNLLNGTTVTINGIQAPIYYVSPVQLNVQVPFEVGAGPAQLVVTVNGQASAPAPFQVQGVAPAICGDFAAPNPAAGEPKLCIGPSGQAGDFETLYVTGQGAVSPAVSTGAAPFAMTAIGNLPRPAQQPVAVTVGGAPATILFAGIPSWSVGVLEIDFVVPPVTPGNQPVVVSIGGQSSSPAYFTVLP
jgi:adhesin/invasin